MGMFFIVNLAFCFLHEEVWFPVSSIRFCTHAYNKIIVIPLER